MNPPQIRDEVLKASILQNIPPALIAAVILQESNGYRFAFRYEEDFYLTYVMQKSRGDLIGFVPTNISLTSEKRARATSWGLCQVMGQTARELGFSRTSLVELCEVDLGIEYGAKYLRRCLDQKSQDVYRALLKYNGNANKNYAAEVLARIDSGQVNSIIGA